MRTIGGLLGLGLAMWSGAAAAAGGHQIYVGGCVPGANHVDTIQGAVTAIGTPGTIDVCPGTYGEQVVIDGKAITLKGVAANGDSAATIVVPLGGMTQNATSVGGSGAPYAAQIVVRNGAVVTIQNIVVDGTGNGINGCAPDLIGILFQDSSGTVKSSTIVNEVLGSPGLIGCQSGDGFYAQTSANNTTSRSITLSSNYVANYQKNGITGNGAGLTMMITGNTVVGQGPTSGAAENSIQVGFGAAGSVTGNYVGDDVWMPDTIGDPGDAGSGILVFDSPGVTVSKNVVSSTQFGIAIEAADYGPSYPTSSDNATVTNNRVSGTQIFDGIDICGSSGTTVGSNTVTGSAESGIHLDSSCSPPTTGDTVNNNLINTACAGILVGSGSYTPATVGNTILNTPTQIMTGTDICQAAPPSPAMSALARTRTRRHASPLR